MKTKINKKYLKDFEKKIANLYEQKKIRGPIIFAKVNHGNAFFLSTKDTDIIEPINPPRNTNPAPLKIISMGS